MFIDAIPVVRVEEIEAAYSVVIVAITDVSLIIVALA